MATQGAAPTAAPATAIRHQDAVVSTRGRVYMVLLALQFGMQPLLQKACVDKHEVNRISLIIVTETTKVALCSFLILSSGPKVYRPMLESWTLSGSLAAAALPAAGYAAQNLLTQLAYANLDSLTFNLLNQTKTLFAAVCLYLVMGKRQSPQQLVALFLLLVAAILLHSDHGGGGGGGSSSSGGATSQFSSRADEEEAMLARLWLGILPVVGAASLSGLTGAITQHTLQRAGRNASLLSLELAVYGVMALFVTSALGWSVAEGGPSGGLDFFFRGWTSWTWLPVLSQALGGLIVGQVTKHAGSVRKGFALIGGIFVTAAVQSTIENSPLTKIHWAAAVLTAGGTYLHANFPYRAPKEAGKTL